MSEKIDTNYIEQTLSKAVTELLEIGGYPIDVTRVCNYLSIDLLRQTDLQGKLACAVRTESSYHVQISDKNKSGHKLHDEMARFLILHEIAHILLEARASIAPVTKSEYWQHEYFADNFARRMLVPGFAISALKDAETKIDHETILNLIIEIAREAQAPWTSVAHRISESSDWSPIFLVFRRTGTEKTWKVVTTTLPAAKEKGRLINIDDALNSLLFDATETEAKISVSKTAMSQTKALSLRNYAYGTLMAVNSHVVRGVFSRSTKQQSKSQFPLQIGFAM